MRELLDEGSSRSRSCSCTRSRTRPRAARGARSRAEVMQRGGPRGTGRAVERGRADRARGLARERDGDPGVRGGAGAQAARSASKRSCAETRLPALAEDRARLRRRHQHPLPAPVRDGDVRPGRRHHGRPLPGEDDRRVENIVCSDVGGTSFDAGCITGGILPIDREPPFQHMYVNVPMLDIRSIGAGTGTYIRLDPDTHRLKLGPDSAGGTPGPGVPGDAATRSRRSATATCCSASSTRRTTWAAASR